MNRLKRSWAIFKRSLNVLLQNRKLLVFPLVTAVVEKIYIGALYVYAAEGVVPESFDQATLDMAWKVKG